MSSTVPPRSLHGSSAPRARGRAPADRIGSDLRKDQPSSSPRSTYPQPPSFRRKGAQIEIACPRCKAATGEPCRDRSGRERTRVHVARDRARQAAVAARQAQPAPVERIDEAWARELLPAEHPPFVVSAAAVLVFQGHEPTADTVLDRLRASGRDMETLGG